MFVFFDGEEAMVQYSDGDGLWGSKFFVDDLKTKDEIKRLKAMVLLDMIGDKDLNVTVAGTMGQQYAIATLATEEEAAFDEFGNDHDRLGRLEQIMRIAELRIVHGFLHRDVGSPDQFSLFGGGLCGD